MAGFISLADAKAHLRVVEPDEDELIQRLVDAASELVERETGLVAVDRAETFAFDGFGRDLELRLRPVDPGTVTVTYLDPNGDEQIFADIRTVERLGTIRIMPAIGACWPVAACVPGSVTVTATIGFGATDADGAPEAPESVRHAVRLCVGHWFANREAATGGSAITEVPLGFAFLLRHGRLPRL